MWLIAGLGNPGAEYEQTRHNAGFHAVDMLADRYGISLSKSKFHGIYGKGSIDGHEVCLLKPQTFMNRSGVSVSEAARFFKIPLAQIIVLYDDLDLALAKMRIKCGGGHGGHNGLRDIDRAMGKDYWRIRLGIDRPEHKGQVTSYVLGAFSAEERVHMTPLYEEITRYIPYLLAGNADRMMSEVARHTLPNKAS